MVDLLDEITKSNSNLEFTVTPEKDGKYGSMQGTVWDGMIGHLIADVGYVKRYCIQLLTETFCLHIA